MECTQQISNEPINKWYFGCNANEELKLYLKQNCKYQKVLFIVNQTYFDYAKSFGNEEYEQILLPSDAISFENLDNSYPNIRFVIGFGDSNEISKAKYLAQAINAECVIYINNIIPIDYLMKQTLLLVGKEWKVLNCTLTPHIIIDENNIKLSTRENVVDSISSLYSLLGFFADYLINEEIFKTECVASVFKDVKMLYNKLYSIMNRVRVLESEAICELMDITIELIPILQNLNYSTDYTKEHSWAILYKYLNEYSFSLPIMKMIAFDILLNMYKNFIRKFDSLRYGCIDIEKRTKLFDKYLSKSSFNFVLEEMLCNKKMQYIIKNSISSINQKLEILSEISFRLKSKIQDIMQDKGYSISVGLNKENCVLASYFVADIIKDKNFVKIIKDFGVLDFN